MGYCSPSRPFSFVDVIVIEVGYWNKNENASRQTWYCNIIFIFGLSVIIVPLVKSCFSYRLWFGQGVHWPHNKQAHPIPRAQVSNRDCPVHVHQHPHGQRTVTQRRPGGPRTHVHVLLARIPPLAGTQGRHPQGTLPKDWGHKESHTHWGSLWKLPW